MKKRISQSVAFLIFMLIARPCWSLTVATFNMEYFSVSGDKAYNGKERSELARKIIASKADILALQEIEGQSSMSVFVSEDLPGWSFAGNDTSGVQDLYFLWNPERVASTCPPRPCMEDESINWKGELHRLFQRPPLLGTFKDLSSDAVFSIVNVHLQGLSTRGQKDKLEAVAANNGIRQAQILSLGLISKEHDEPLFIMGDFNSTELQIAPFPTFELERGNSYDDLQCTIDHIGYVNMRPERDWNIKVLETSIPERSRAGHQHPDHDMVILSMPSFPN